MIQSRKCYLFLIYFGVGYFIAIAFIYIFHTNFVKFSCESYCLNEWQDKTEDINDFEDFDNEFGTPDGRHIVPNHVHFIRFKYEDVSFIHAACIFAAFKHQKPEKLYIHYDTKPRGRYWDVLMDIPGFKEVLVLDRIRMPVEVFNHEMTWKNKKWHSGDFTRLKLLIKYGGIFLDNDSLFIRNVDDFRKYEATVSWLKNWMLMNQCVIAHRNSRFIRLWYESYREYNATDWYWNAGEKPTYEILQYKPYLVHRIQHLLVTDQKFKQIYLYNWTGWKTHYVIHLNARWTDDLEKENLNLSHIGHYPAVFNETNVANYKATIRDIIYHAFPPGFIESASTAANYQLSIGCWILFIIIQTT